MLTKDNHNRKVIDPPNVFLCSICGIKHESIDHLFLQGRYARDMLNKILSTFRALQVSLQNGIMFKKTYAISRRAHGFGGDRCVGGLKKAKQNKFSSLLKQDEYVGQ